MSIYNIEVEQMDGLLTNLEEHKDKVMLIVNTASKCGYTPQLQDLQDLYDKYKDSGLVILGFPTRQFLKQEFDTNTEILNFCRANYGVSFPMYAKTKVRGKNKTKLFKYLIENSPNRRNKKVKWNFEKFLVNRNGAIVNRYSAKVNPKYIKKDIEILL
jgi:glutathione peroxidase